jgi:hypothetical protein
MGVSKSNIQKYLKHPIELANVDHDRMNARFAMAKLLNELGDKADEKLGKLENPARRLVRDLVSATRQPPP